MIKDNVGGATKQTQSGPKEARVEPASSIRSLGDSSWNPSSMGVQQENPTRNLSQTPQPDARRDTVEVTIRLSRKAFEWMDRINDDGDLPPSEQASLIVEDQLNGEMKNNRVQKEVA